MVWLICLSVALLYNSSKEIYGNAMVFSLACADLVLFKI